MIKLIILSALIIFTPAVAQAHGAVLGAQAHTVGSAGSAGLVELAAVLSVFGVSGWLVFRKKKR